MSNIINLLDTSKIEFKIFQAVKSVASNLNCEAYAIGGYVRDSILGVETNETYPDIDITVKGDYIIFAEHLAPEIANHLARSVEVPVSVVLEQQIRGGIVTTVTATSEI